MPGIPLPERQLAVDDHAAGRERALADSPASQGARVEHVGVRVVCRVERRSRCLGSERLPGNGGRVTSDRGKAHHSPADAPGVHERVTQDVDRRGRDAGERPEDVGGNECLSASIPEK